MLVFSFIFLSNLFYLYFDLEKLLALLFILLFFVLYRLMIVVVATDYRQYKDYFSNFFSKEYSNFLNIFYMHVVCIKELKYLLCNINQTLKILFLNLRDYLRVNFLRYAGNINIILIMCWLFALKSIYSIAMLSVHIKIVYAIKC